MNLLAESVQIDFFKSTDRSTENADAIRQEAIDVVKSLVIVGSQLVEPLQIFEGRQRLSGSAGESSTI